jgi:NAD(P)-dependent dehydrogenase (short-subunit alcohol dehydrogenase family)
MVCFNVAAKTSKPKTVLITGGLSGIGKEMAIAFKNDGWNVWVTSRTPEKYESLPGVNARQLDITDSASIKKLIAEIKNKDGRIDVLVNNAGYGIVGPQEAVSEAQVKDLFAVNVFGPLQLIQESLPLLRASHDGHIINISSTSGMRALPGLGTYAASKMALEGISEAFAAELAPWNIKVSIVEPGSVANDWSKNAQVAANINQFHGYNTFTTKLQNTLISKSIEVGQKQEEIAILVLSIAKNSNPDLRYQTGKQSSDLAAELWKDPSGNQLRDKMIGFVKPYYPQVGIN